MVFVRSWSYFILFNQQAIVLPFCLGDKGKTAPDFFSFYPGKWSSDVLARRKGCNRYVKRSIVQHTLLSVKNSHSLLSWRYYVGARLKFWRRSRVPKKGSRDEAVFLAASPLVTAPPSNLTRLLHNTASYAGYCRTCGLHQLIFLLHVKQVFCYW